MNRSPAILHRSRRVAVIACAVLWIGAFVVTHVPAEKLPETYLGDEELHFLGFFALSGLFVLSLAAYNAAPVRRVVIVMCVMATYAAFDEATQTLFNRYAAWQDWLADVAGAAAAIIVTESLLRALSKRRERIAR